MSQREVGTPGDVGEDDAAEVLPVGNRGALPERGQVGGQIVQLLQSKALA